MHARLLACLLLGSALLACASLSAQEAVGLDADAVTVRWDVQE